MRDNKAADALAGARDVFFRCGYEGASVDEIAAKGRVSKATLYAHFPSKEELFLRVIEAECARLASEVVRPLEDGSDLQSQLQQLARRMLDLVMDDEYIRLLRTCIGATEALPEAGRQYMQAGPTQARTFIERIFEGAKKRGRLRIDDTQLASERFIHLCISGVLMPRLLAVERTVDREKYVKHAVADFLKLYESKNGETPIKTEG